MAVRSTTAGAPSSFAFSAGVRIMSGPDSSRPNIATHAIFPPLLIRTSGFKEFLRQRGWKVIAIVIVYYLIRDSFLYILLPYLVAREIL